MKKFFNNQGSFIVGAVIIGFILNYTNCVTDNYCEPDPIYGGCPSSCEFGSLSQLAAKSLGVYVLFNLGAFLGKENLKKKENLKEFLGFEGLKYTIREIDADWKVEEQKYKDSTDKLINDMEKRKV